MRLDRHVQAAISKRSSEVKQRHHEELCKEGTEANLRILAVFECDPQIKSHVPIVETIFMTLVGTFVGREKTSEHNPQACYDLYDRVRSRARMPDIDGDGLNGALSIHQGVIGVSSRRQTYYCIICKRELRPNTSHRDHGRLVELGNPLGPRRCQRCDRVSKTTAKNESQVQMDPFIAEASRENNMSYGLLQDIPTFVEILFVQHHVSQGLVFLAGWKSLGVKIVPHS